MKTANKYTYWNVIQQHYGQGWEDVSHYEANSSGVSIEKTQVKYTRKDGTIGEKLTSLCRADLSEYIRTGYPTRVIFRKELKTAVQ